MPSRLALGERRLVLYQQLAGLDAKSTLQGPKLSIMYLGAVEAILAGNTDRFALASHNLREMIHLLPNALVDDVRSLGERMNDKVAALSARWAKAQRSNCHDGKGGWAGSIDPALSRFLKSAAAFFDWHRENREARVAEMVEALSRLDVSGRRLPAPLAKTNADYWQEMANYFVAVCHHGLATTEDEFTMWLEALEEFLLARLQPRTFERARELDALIRSGGRKDA